jgi:hypothetical protein
MKCRNGFVSNSSSSSFIVASNPKKTKFKILVEVDLNEYVDNTITTMEELDAHKKKEEEYGEFDEAQYKKCAKAIKAGKTVFFGSFSTDDGDDTSALLAERGLKKEDMPKGAEIIFTQEGF